ncbi:hypothetical protein KK420_17090 [Clostridioides difficile]|nr:hypothetical protein [Clostridioides difficile]
MNRGGTTRVNSRPLAEARGGSFNIIFKRAENYIAIDTFLKNNQNILKIKRRGRIL